MTTTTRSIRSARAFRGAPRSRRWLPAVALRSDGRYQIATGTTLATSQRVCATEPYRAQPTPAFCSGFLAAPDLFVTAGHCIADASACAGTTIAFGFRMNDASTVRSVVDAGDVYRCAAIVGRAQTSTDDWAVIRLDRAVTGRSPLPIRRAGAVSLGAPLLVIGHPSGLPQKLAAGATVRNNSPSSYFEANLDTYGGNSGSPVFNAATGEVEGVLVRGNVDYVYRSTERCYVSNVCPDTGCPGGAGWESVTRASRFVALVPATPDCSANGVCNIACAEGTDPDCAVAPDCSADGACNTACAEGADPDCAALPTTEAVCNDGADDDRDGRVDCADADCTGSPACPSARCGDGVCGVGESCDGRSGTTSCPGDCAGRLGGKPARRYCYVNGACQGPGCR